MTEVIREAGKLGALPSYSEAEKPRLKVCMRHLNLDKAPDLVDRASRVDAWPMFLNDKLGCCTCACAGHEIQAWTAYGSKEYTVTDEDILWAYEDIAGYNPKTGQGDNGAVVQDVLNYWRKKGVGGHKILAFAQLNYRNLDEVKQALYHFGSVYLGVSVPQSAPEQFAAHQPWTVVPGSPIVGGHAIPIQKIDGNKLYVVTWGALQEVTEEWFETYCTEAWVVITRDWLNAQGRDVLGDDLNRLAVEFTELTGQAHPFGLPPWWQRMMCR